MRPFPLGSGEMAAITLSVANRKFILAGTTSNGALPARAAKLSVDARVGAVCELALAQEQQYQDDTATKTALADKLPISPP